MVQVIFKLTNIPWIISKDVVLAVQYFYLVYLVKRVISLVDTAQYS